MNFFLPKSRFTLITLFIFLLLGGLVYFMTIKFPSLVSKNAKNQTANNNLSSDKNNSESAAFFIPPKSQLKEVEVYGRIVKLTDVEVEQTGASHKIVMNNNTLIMAKSNDDKLKQQEGNTVTLVGEIPIDDTINPEAILSVKYIQFK